MGWKAGLQTLRTQQVQNTPQLMSGWFGICDVKASVGVGGVRRKSWATLRVWCRLWSWWYLYVYSTCGGATIL